MSCFPFSTYPRQTILETNQARNDMNVTSQPLVSIVTPVYNGEDHLRECIESVLAQTYQNWDYTIVNNCSTDSSLAIANEYANRNPRIRVISNQRFLPIIENHNIAMRQISPDSKYCKMLFADDWMYPSFIAQMVSIAERHARVGLVGAYTMDGRTVLWQGPPYPSHCVPGPEVCRRTLLDGAYVFGTMTSLLVRSDLVRKRSAFFNERNLHADQEACFDVLQESDFGFIHQVLSFSRPRERSNGSFAREYDSLILGNLVVLLRYGPIFLTPKEYRECWKELRREYHRILAKNVFKVRSKQFWKYHEETLQAFGAHISRWILLKSMVAEVVDHVAHPLTTIEKSVKWWSAALRRTLNRIRTDNERRAGAVVFNEQPERDEKASHV